MSTPNLPIIILQLGTLTVEQDYNTKLYVWTCRRLKTRSTYGYNYIYDCVKDYETTLRKQRPELFRTFTANTIQPELPKNVINVDFTKKVKLP